MKSAQINRYGRSEVIEINQNTPLLNLSSEKILVDVKAAGVNPIDWKIREDYMKQMISLQFPSTLGMDFSGIIKGLVKIFLRKSINKEMKFMDKLQ
jgi:NADPH:quinone reductase-like Zn-dependent oxidoreductase